MRKVIKEANAAEHYAAAGALVYTTKIVESESMGVCMYECPAMRFVMLRGIELKVGMGQAHEVCGHIFKATPPGVKGHPGVNLP